MNILNRILDYKKEEDAVRKILVPETELMKSSLFKRKCISLKQVLQDDSKSGIIAEFKRKSPSKGFINRDADVKKITYAYTKHGASGLSVLTDNHFFGGNTGDLVIARKNNIPILRKDFIIDQYQLLVSKAMGADAILLIASCLTKLKVKRFAAYARELGLEVLLEIHDEKEIGHICNDIDMVGINNRNLKNFEVDINRSIELSRSIPADKVKIAESGIADIETVKMFKTAGYKGFLMGETFMKEKDPGKSFGNFVKLL
jgi:indole-3-glycerol phosphate synthase